MRNASIIRIVDWIELEIPGQIEKSPHIMHTNYSWIIRRWCYGDKPHRVEWAKQFCPFKALPKIWITTTKMRSSIGVWSTKFGGWPLCCVYYIWLKYVFDIILWVGCGVILIEILKRCAIGVEQYLSAAESRGKGALELIVLAVWQTNMVSVLLYSYIYTCVIYAGVYNAMRYIRSKHDMDSTVIDYIMGWRKQIHSVWGKSNNGWPWNTRPWSRP